MYSILLLSLLHSITATIYTVTPDYGRSANITCHNCHNLQYYLLNVTQYFTSNTQLCFLPGLYRPRTNRLIIQNVYNISLIGCPANSTTRRREILIDCNSLLILMRNISRLTIRNIIIAATNPQGFYKWAPLLTIKDCSSVTLDHFNISKFIVQQARNFALLGINIIGESHFNHVDCLGKMQLLYNETHTDEEHHILLISKIN